MACYACDDCLRHKSKGGKCPLWESWCPLDKVITDKKEQEEMKNTISFLKKQIKYLEDKQNANYECEFDNAIISLKNAVLELEETIDEEMLELYKEVYGDSKE